MGLVYSSGIMLCAGFSTSEIQHPVHAADKDVSREDVISNCASITTSFVKPD